MKLPSRMQSCHTCKCTCLQEAHKATLCTHVHQAATYNNLSFKAWLFNLCNAGLATARGGSKLDVAMDAESKTPIVSSQALQFHRQERRLSEDLDELEKLVQRGTYVDSSRFYRILKRCIVQKNLVLGKRVHALTVKSGYESNAFLANHIICMYASHERVEEAMQVFIRVAAPNSHMWASIILACARHGQATRAVRLYHQMEQSSVKPDNHLFVAILKACAVAGDLTSGKEVHANILRSSDESNIFVGNGLVNMYAKCGSLEDARRVFDRLCIKDLVTWTAMIAGYAQKGMGKEALALYATMQKQGTTLANRVTYVCVLQACASIGALHEGMQVHFQIQQRGLEADVVVGSCLVDMYVKCGRLGDARKVFDRLTNRNIVTWTVMIAGYAEHGLGQEALTLYARMQKAGMTPANPVTFVCLLKACGSVAALHQGKQLHVQVQELGLEEDVVVGNSLVDMYAKCGSLEDACRVFERLTSKDVVTWNTMIAGYVEQGRGQEALSLYASMQQDSKTPANHVTFVCLLKACGSIGALQQGKEFHFQIRKQGLEADVVVGSSLVDMYGKCGSLVDARGVFDRLLRRDVVTWTAMIAGYVENGFGEEALTLYKCMQQDGMTPADLVTFSYLMKACGSVGDLHQGKKLHSQMLELGLEPDVFVGSCLVDMYAKCGSLEDARTVFDLLLSRNVVTWNAMMAGYAEHGLGREALTLYAGMQQDGDILANNVTFACLLKACASVGALHQGRQLHIQILEKGLGADVIVGNSLVDMYAKCGSLEEAQRVFDSLPTRDVVTWTALVNGYAQHSNAEMAIQSFEKMQQHGVEPDDVSFIAVLVACSHNSLVNEGYRYFKTMVEDYGITPTVYHYTCMVDLLGRSGHLDEAENVLQSMPFENEAVGWISLLNACKSHGDVKRGKRCFERLLTLEPESATAYVLLAAIYANAGRWRDAHRIESLRKCAGAKKQPATACIEVKGIVHEFIVGQDRADMSSKLRSMNSSLKDGGHVPHTELVLKAVSDSEKEDSLCGHAEKLALAYGLLNSADGTPLLVTKNLRMCNDCHSATKIMSRLEKREITVRDAHRVHRFVDGSCTCGDRH